MIIGCAFLLTGGTALAAQDCASVRQKSGGAAAQKCLFSEQENLLKQQLAAYKTMIDRTKETVKVRYDAVINAEKFAWKDVDLKMQTEEANRKLRIAQLGSGTEHAEQMQIEKNLLSRLQKIRSLTASIHSKKVSRLQKRRDMELTEYDNALMEYELQLRQQQMTAL